MSLRLLRRAAIVVETPITTSDAPTLGGPHISIPAEPLRPTAPEPTPAPSAAPSWEPGHCWHDGHIEHLGRRIGVTVLDEARGALLPCLHSNEAGR